jgi:hypothetical protein
LLTYLVLLCSVLRSELRARQDLVAENLALRQQLAVLTRPKRRPRLTPTDRLFWSCLSSLVSLVALALHALACPARHRHPLAPVSLATLLDVEEPTRASRSAAYPTRGSGSDPGDGQGEPALGQHPHPGRASQTRLRGQHSVRETVPTSGPT